MSASLINTLVSIGIVSCISWATYVTKVLIETRTEVKFIKLSLKGDL